MSLVNIWLLEMPSMWTITNTDGVTTELGVQDKISDAKTGIKSLHFYSTGAL